MNSIQLVGNLTKDPELSKTPSGIATSTVTLAVKVPYKTETETDFFQVRLWKQQAEYVCKYANKGTKIGLCGFLRTSNFTTKEGEKRYITYVEADKVEIMSNGNNGEKQVTMAKPTLSNLPQVDDADLPF